MRALIKSTTARFRRAGIEFNAKGVEIDLNTLSAAQVHAIYDEPRLKVELLELPKDQGKAPGQNQEGAASLGRIPEAGVGDDGAAVTSKPTGASAPAGAESAHTPPAASGTQQGTTGDEQTPAAAVAAVVSASAEAGTGGAAVGSQLRMPAKPQKSKPKA